MDEFLKRITGQIKDIYSKLSVAKRIIIFSIVGVVAVSFLVLFSVSSAVPNSLLFTGLSSKDFGSVTKKLEELGYFYETKGTTNIFVKPKDREVIMTRLAQEQMIPQGIPGWQLFDTTKWTETDKELDVKYMRALRSAIKSHIASLRNIQKADVEIAITDDELFAKNSEYTAAVTVYLAPGYEKLSRKEVKGIVYLVSRAVGNRLKPENVTITDDSGKIISDFNDPSDEPQIEMKIVENRRKIQEKVRVKLLKDINAGLANIYNERVQIVRLNMDFNWDKVTQDKKEHTPIEMVPQDKTKPYNTRKTKDSLTISEKDTEEHFKGHGYNPEGPAGTESNKPPGYKASDDQYAKYDKKETVRNYGVNTINTNIIRDPFDVTSVSVAIAIDGVQDLPRNPDGSYDLDPAKRPVQTPVPAEDLKKIENNVKKSINYDVKRGDQVAVENIMFDRSKEWERIRDEFRRKEQIKRLILAALIGVFAIFLGFVLFSAIKKEVARRRRIHEEQLALEQQRMREAALRAAEEEGVDVELSLEERARLELQENAINMARERPDDVAQLLRTWLADE